MKPLCRQILSYLLPVAVLLGCDDKTTGTMDETNHAATAIVYSADGKPVPQALVQAFRRDDTSRVAAATVITGADGSYALPSLENGLYRVIARKGPLVGVQDSVYAAAGKSTAGSDTLEGAPVAAGVVTMTGDDNPASVLVQVQGTDVLVNVDADGRFSLNSLAAGTYTLRLSTELEGYTVTTRVIRIQRGQTTVLDTIAMNYTDVPPVTGLTGRIDSATGQVRLSWSLPSLKGVRDVQISRVEKSSSIAADVLGVSDSGSFTDVLWQTAVPTTWLYTAQIRMLDGRVGRTAYVTVVQPVHPASKPQIRMGIGDSLNLSLKDSSSWGQPRTGDSATLSILVHKAVASLASVHVHSGFFGFDTVIPLQGDSARLRIRFLVPKDESGVLVGVVKDAMGRSDSISIPFFPSAMDSSVAQPAVPGDSLWSRISADTLRPSFASVDSSAAGQNPLRLFGTNFDSTTWTLSLLDSLHCGDIYAVVDTSTMPARVNVYASGFSCTAGASRIAVPLGLLYRRSFVLYNAGTYVRQF